MRSIFILYYLIAFTISHYRSKNIDSVRIICQHAPSLINSLGDKSCTPLHVAVACGYHEAVQFCLNFGADAEKRLRFIH